MDIKIASYNIRIDLASDGEHAWNFRKEGLTALIKDLNCDFIGLQEARRSQYEYLKKHSGYELFGDYRSFANDPNNEACPILFHPDRFILERGDTFWLSETPEKISKYQNADCLRIATWGIFKSKQTGLRLAFINTHLDHISQEARVFGAQVLAAFIKHNFVELPVFLTGDFNENEHGQWHQVLAEHGMMDTRQTSQTPPLGPAGTATGYAFEKPVAIEDYVHIDFIFANHLSTIHEAVTLNHQTAAKPLSDHLLIYVKAELTQ